MKQEEVKKKIDNRKVSREIVKTILDYGISEEQKIDIMYMLSLELESNKVMKEISDYLKKFRVKFNTDDHDDTIKTKSNTLIT
jgi:predicted transposase YdaD